MMNFKANHRKIFVADNDGEMVAVIGSANPHGGSSAHSNIAVLIRGDIWRSVYQAEAAVARLSGGTLSPIESGTRQPAAPPTVTASILTEHQIKRALVKEITAAELSDEIRLAQFYLSDREIIKALLSAAARGVEIPIILDPTRMPSAMKKMVSPTGRLQANWLKNQMEISSCGGMKHMVNSSIRSCSYPPEK